MRTIFFCFALGLLCGCSTPLKHEFKSEREVVALEGLAVADYASAGKSWLAQKSVIRVNGDVLDDAGRMVYASNTGDSKVAMTGVTAATSECDLIRHVLWDDHHGFWVADQLIARKDGEYTLEQEWFIRGDLTCRGQGVEALRPVGDQMAALSVQVPASVGFKLEKDHLIFRRSARLKAGESMILPTFLLEQTGRRREQLRVCEVAPQSYVAIFGETRSMAAIGDSRLDAHIFSENATFVCENGTINSRGHHFDMIEFYTDLFNLKI